MLNSPHDSLIEYKRFLMDSFKWWLSGSEWIMVVQDLINFFTHRGEMAPEDGYQVIRHYPRRWIFRYACKDAPATQFVVKAFPLKKLRQQIKYRRWGWSEFNNLLIARERGIPAPYPYAYGEWRHWGLVRMNLVILEDLAPLQDIVSLLREGTLSASTLFKLLDQISELFGKFYQASCNHIDLSAGNIMVDPEGLLMPRPIDFGYVSFLLKPSLLILVSQTARFSQSLREWISLKDFEEWFINLLKKVAPEERPEKWWESFKTFYLNEDLSRADRLQLYSG